MLDHGIIIQINRNILMLMSIYFAQKNQLESYKRMFIRLVRALDLFSAALVITHFTF